MFEKLRLTDAALNSNYMKSVRMFLRKKKFYEKKTQSFSVVNYPTLEKRAESFLKITNEAGIYSSPNLLN